MRACLACRNNPVTDTFTCNDCNDELHGLLPRIPDLAADLEIEITRQARKGGQGGGGRTRSFERPLEFNQAASDALAQLRVVLVSTCLTLALGQRLPSDTITAMAQWLMVNEAAVPLRPEAGDIITGISAAFANGSRVIDNPPERVYMGNCPCGAELMADKDAAFIQCPNPRCGATGSVQDAIDHRNQEARDHLLTAMEIVTLTGGKSTIYRWIKDCRLLPAITTPDGEELFRYGDVLDLKAQRKAA